MSPTSVTLTHTNSQAAVLETNSDALQLPEKLWDRRSLVNTLLESDERHEQEAVLKALLCDPESLVSEHAALQFVAQCQKQDDPDRLSSVVKLVIQDAPYLSARVLIRALNATKEHEQELLSAILGDTSLDWRIRHQAGEVFAAGAPYDAIYAAACSRDETVRYFALKGAERYAERAIPVFLATLDSDAERLHLPAAQGLYRSLQAIVRTEQAVFWAAAKKAFPGSHNVLGRTVAQWGSLEQAAESLDTLDLGRREALLKHTLRRAESVHRKARPILRHILETGTSDFLHRARSARISA